VLSGQELLKRWAQEAILLGFNFGPVAVVRAHMPHSQTMEMSMRVSSRRMSFLKLLRETQKVHLETRIADFELSNKNNKIKGKNLAA